MSGKGRANWSRWCAVALTGMALLLVTFLPANAASQAQWRFWGEGQQVGTTTDGYGIYQGSIKYINSTNPSPSAVKTLAPSTPTAPPAVFLSDGKNFEGHYIPSAGISWNSSPPGQMTGLMPSYFFYMQGGKIYRVSTVVGTDSAPVPVQISKESKITAPYICRVNTLIDWSNASESAIYYQLTGQGGKCSDSLNKMVTLNMENAAAPILTGSIYPTGILLNGWYGAVDTSTKPYTVEICPNSSLTSCTTTGHFTNLSLSAVYSMDNTRFVGTLDGILGYYTYSGANKGNYGILYIPGSSELVSDAKIDSGGTVYFEVVGTGTQTTYTNSIMKVAVPVSGNAETVITLAQVPTVKPINSLNLSLTPSYVFFSVPNGATARGSNDGAFAYSVLKSNSSKTTPNTLAQAYVNGGAITDWFYYEDSLGHVTRVGLDGKNSTSLPGPGLMIGASYGGTGNWFDDFDPQGTPYVIVYTGGNLESFAYGKALTSGGTNLGPFPINLSNPTTMQFGDKMLGSAERRDCDYSKNRDVFFIDPTSAGSFARLSDDNTAKAVSKAKVGND